MIVLVLLLLLLMLLTFQHQHVAGNRHIDVLDVEAGQFGAELVSLVVLAEIDRRRSKAKAAVRAPRHVDVEHAAH